MVNGRVAVENVPDRSLGEYKIIFFSVNYILDIF